MKLIKISIIALLGLQTTNILSSDLQKTVINAAVFFGAYYGFNAMLTCIHEASHRSADILLRNAKEHKQIKLENYGMTAYTVSPNKKDSETDQEFKKKQIINLIAGPTVAAGISLLTFVLIKNSLIGLAISSAGIIGELSNLVPDTNLSSDGSRIYKHLYSQYPSKRATAIGYTLLATTLAGIIYSA